MFQFIKRIIATAIGCFLGAIATVVALIFILALLSRAVRMGAGNDPIKPHSVLHLEMDGRLLERLRPMDFDWMAGTSIFAEDQSIGLYEALRALQAAKSDGRIEGVYLQIGGFEAGWAGVTALRRALKDFSASGKFVAAYAQQYDDKAYYLATGADRIFMQPNGALELNGLSMSEAFFRGLLDKLELEPRIFRVGRFKSAVEPFLLEKMSNESRIQNQALLDDIWSVARADIASTTKKPKEVIDKAISNLEIASPKSAESMGLIKGLLYEDELREMIADQTLGKDKDEDLRLVSIRHYLHELGPDLGKKVKSKKKVAVIFAEGEIGTGPSGRDRIGSDGLVHELRDAEQDEDVKAIVMRINSPGGDALASDVIWREIYSINEDIPVVVSMADVAASGGYYIATGGRYIFAEPTTITGSIGVFGVLVNAEKFFKKKLSVNFDRVTTHAHSAIGDFTKPMDTIEANYIQAGVERVYRRFLEVVKEGRGFERMEDVEALAEGRVWSGLRAQDIGLVDELGGLQSAIKKAAEFAELGTDYSVETYPKDSDTISMIIERISDAATDSMLGGTPLSKIKSLSKQLLPAHSGVYARLPSDLEIE